MCVDWLPCSRALATAAVVRQKVKYCLQAAVLFAIELNFAP
jgi:hypothetical protein